MFFGSTCISWYSRRQKIVLRSSTKAKYRAMSVAIVEVTWVTFLLGDLGVRLYEPPQLFSDNLSALKLTINPKFL